MVKKLSLEISDEVYDQLSSLSAFYKQDINQTIVSVLEIVGLEHCHITNWNSASGRSTDIGGTLVEMFLTSIHSIGLFNWVLEELKAEGQFTLEDFEFDLEKNYFRFLYAAYSDSPLNIYSFDVTKENGSASLSTNTGIYVKQTSQESLDKLRKVISDFSDPFDLSEFNIEIEDDDEEMWTIRIDCSDESLDYLPTIKQMSRVVKQILKKAGVKQKSSS